MNTHESFQRAPGAPKLPTTPLRFIWYFIWLKPWWYGAMVVVETAHATCGILMPYALSQIIKAVTRTQGHSMALVQSLSWPLTLFLLLSVGEVLFGRAGGTMQVLLGPPQRQTVTRAIYAYLQHHSYRYFSNNFAGALAHRISETSMGVNQTVWAIIFDFWPIAIVFGVSINLLYHAHHMLAGFVSIWVVLFVGFSYWLATKAQPHAVNAAAARSETTGKVVDSVTNLTSSKLFARLGFERSYLDNRLHEELRMVRKSNWYSERVRWFQFISAAALKVGILYYALNLWGAGEIGVGDFVMATSLSLLIINEARNLSRRFLEFFEFVGNVSNGVNTIVRPHELVDRPDAKPARISSGAIEFRNIDFGYSPDRKVFTGLNVSIRAGERVGLVGSSGSGKSTFVSLILRMYDPQDGAILIDDVDIRTMTQDSLHEQLSLIPQDPNLFHRSLLENIRYGRLEASEEEVTEAARKAHAHEFIAQIKDGYASMVGERGVKLSGGQRQRIAIARVILKNAPVLILDEATSSLDSITEQAIQETLDEVMQGKTVIVVAHRLSTIAHLDRILVFDGGRVIEDGSHAQLLARQGAYYRLWSRQAGGFLPEDVGGDHPGGPTASPTTGVLDDRLTVDENIRDATPNPEPAGPVQTATT
ncbi:MAG TPA: ABC transporter ATP-binding protein, partial [Rhodocyclaceae bacterium]|nr:ABC transporter ATP-binding protein [Rhodocyclaceae bacterium]